MIEIRVAGVPAPQGSKRHVGGGRMVEQSRAVGPWREAVRAETQRARKPPGGLAGPVALELVFWLPRPKSAAKRVIRPAKRPDLDKLARAVLDGLTAGGAFADDGQVVELRAAKYFTAPGQVTGCLIRADLAWAEEAGEL